MWGGIAWGGIVWVGIMWDGIVGDGVGWGPSGASGAPASLRTSVRAVCMSGAKDEDSPMRVVREPRTRPAIPSPSSADGGSPSTSSRQAWSPLTTRAARRRVSIDSSTNGAHGATAQTISCLCAAASSPSAS